MKPGPPNPGVHQTRQTLPKSRYANRYPAVEHSAEMRVFSHGPLLAVIRSMADDAVRAEFLQTNSSSIVGLRRAHIQVKYGPL